MASYILDTSGNISHIKYSGSWVGQVNYKPYGAASPTRLSWAPQHTTVNGWHKDATNHWQTCDICEWDYGKGTHEGNWGSWTPYVYIDIDATNHWRNHNRSCITCGYTEYDNSRELHTWDIKGAWTYNSSDDAKHYRTNNCICGHVGTKDSQAHGGGSTWLNNANNHYHQCPSSPTGCGHVWAVASHTWSGWVNTDPNDHWKVCTVCSRQNERAPHTRRYVYLDTSYHKNWCYICQYVYDAQEAHMLDDTSWESSSAGHWHLCILCDGAGPTEAHHPLWGYSATQHWKNCYECDYQTMAPASHTYSGWSNNENNHWQDCTAGCGYKYQIQSHNHNYHYISNIYHKNNCDTCGRVFNAQEKHTNDSSWHNNLAYHWHVCTLCGGDANYLEHTWNEWSIHRLSYINTTHHWDNKNRNCDVCGQIQDENIRTEHVFNQYGAWNYNSSDDANHYRNKWCPCNASYTKSEKAAHDTATSWLNNANNHYYYCDTCGSPWSIQVHNWNTWATTYTSYSDLQHYNNHYSYCDQCSRLNYTNTREGHTYDYTSINRIEHNNYCRQCSWNVNEAHTNSAEWYHNSVNHWHRCTKCSNQCNLLSHDWLNTNTNVYKDSTYHNFIWNNRCTTCSYNEVTGTLKVHTWGGYEKVDDTNHRRNCTANGCTGYKIDGHNFNNVQLDDNNHRYYCLQECGFSKTVAHTISYVDIGSDVSHNRRCSYCDYLITTSHNYNAWSAWSGWIADNDYTCARTQNRKCNNCDHLQTNLQRNDHNWGAWTSYRWIDQDATYHIKTRNHTCANCTRLVYDNTTETHNYNVYGAWAPGAFDYHTRSVKCLCDRATTNETAAHIWTNNGKIDDTYHFIFCGTCGGNYTQEHSWSSTYVKVNNDQHRQACSISCGAYKYTTHNISLGPWSEWSHGEWSHGDWSGWSGYDATYHRRSRTNTRINTRTRDRNCNNCGAVNIVTETGTETATEYGYAAHTWDNTTINAYYNYSNTQHNTEYNNHCTTTGCGYYTMVNVRESHTLTGSWTSYDSSVHRKQCSKCGGYNYTAHNDWLNISRNEYIDTTRHNFIWNNTCGTCSYSVESGTLTQHTNDSTWHYDSSNHYHLCTVCGGSATKIAHSLTTVPIYTQKSQDYTYHWYQENTYCTTPCGYYSVSEASLEPHSWSDWSNFNGSLHKRVCGQCALDQYESHTFTTSYTYNWYNTDVHYNNGLTTCTVGCGYSLSSSSFEAHSPAYGSWQWYSNTQHYRTKWCSKCDVDMGEEYESHSSYGSWTNYGDATYHRRQCGICHGYNYGQHTKANVSISSTQHRYQCTDDCGWTSTVRSHTFKYTSISNTQHNKYCSNCNYHINESHNNATTITYQIIVGNADFHNQITTISCNNCTYSNTSTLKRPHNYSSWVPESSTQHSATCSQCSYVKYGSHTNWHYQSTDDTYHEKICNDCGYSVSEKHSYVSGICSKCGHTDPTPPC